MRMEAFSFVHAADLHLDSPFAGVGEVAPEVAEVLREATFRAFASVIDACLRHRVDFLLVAGDIFEARDRSLRAQLAFRDGLKRLSDAGIRAYVVHGNHDPLDGWSATIRFPEITHVFPGGAVSSVPVNRDGRTIAVVHGISYDTQEVRENLAVRFPQEKHGTFSIALLHCNVDSNPAHDNYAPCPLRDLSGAGVDYWALGHVHARSVLREAEPAVVYPGNTQGRHPGETGAKGCYLVRVDTGGTPRLTFIPTDVVRWDIQDVDLTDVDTDEDLLRELARACCEIRDRAEGRPVVCRLVLTGRTRLFQHLVRRGYLQDIEHELRKSEGAEEPFVWVERLELRAKPTMDVEARRQAPDLVGSLLRKVDEYRSNPEALRTLREQLSAVEGAMRGWRVIPEPTDEEIVQWLELAEARLLEALGEGS
jgi:DNA repair exonuclease SbcCD nuclease subunit